MNKTTIWIVSMILVIFGLFVWSNKLQNNDPDLVSKNGIHWHPQLHIFVNDVEQEIPEGVGLVGGHNPIHTHDDADKGFLHLEFGSSVTKDMVRLKEFFKIWGKDIDTAFGNLERMTVNNENSEEYGDHIMRDEEVINLYYTK